MTLLGRESFHRRINFGTFCYLIVFMCKTTAAAAAHIESIKINNRKLIEIRRLCCSTCSLIIYATMLSTSFPASPSKTVSPRRIHSAIIILALFLHYQLACNSPIFFCSLFSDFYCWNTGNGPPWSPCPNRMT